MLDAQSSATVEVGAKHETCDLCIVGAGIAGLNALVVASEYLPPDARVILIDRNDRCGGMWNGAYDYVRLHQPHPMFTAGDIAWDWRKPKDHLASRTEVLSHLNHCLDTVRSRIDLVEYYGTNFEGSDEVTADDGNVAQVHVTALGGGNPKTIIARRLINAIGYDIPVPNPMTFTSDAVLSTTPQRLLDDIAPNTEPHVFVVGGGKTGMDTVLALLRERPGAKITLINGKGTVFGNRGLFAPTGGKRWWSGFLIVRCFGDISLRFDGHNEDEVFDYFRKTYAISPDGTGEQFFFGLLSEKENATISAGLDGIVKDYLSDVIDGENGPELVLRGGEHLPVPPSSVVVNCTGHILREPHPYAPYLSDGGTTLSINSRSAIHFLSSVSAYFLTHLFFLNKLPDAKLYALDFDELFTKGRKVWQMCGVTLSYMNSITLLSILPFKVMDGCGLDLDKWFPLPRRLSALIELKRNQKRHFEHCKASLDAVGEKHGITVGPLKCD